MYFVILIITIYNILDKVLHYNIFKVKGSDISIYYDKLV